MLVRRFLPHLNDIATRLYEGLNRLFHKDGLTAKQAPINDDRQVLWLARCLPTYEPVRLPHSDRVQVKHRGHAKT
jgi:hypothetical protein